MFVTFHAVAMVGVPFCQSRQTATTEVRRRKTKNSSWGMMKPNAELRLPLAPVACHPTSLPTMTFQRAFA